MRTLRSTKDPLITASLVKSTLWRWKRSAETLSFQLTVTPNDQKESRTMKSPIPIPLQLHRAMLLRPLNRFKAGRFPTLRRSTSSLKMS